MSKQLSKLKLNNLSVFCRRTQGKPQPSKLEAERKIQEVLAYQSRSTQTETCAEIGKPEL